METVNKIVMIIPPSPWLIKDREIPFYGVLQISAFLKRHTRCEVCVCDLTGLPKELWYIPLGDLYGVTGATPNFVQIRDIIEILKEREPDKPVIVGGTHATVYPEHILKYSKADACVIGDGELTALNIVQGKDWKDIPGIMTREYFTGLPTLVNDIDFFPMPDREAIDYYSYLESSLFNYMDITVKKEGSILACRGCAFDCSFCASRKINQGRVRLKSAKAIVDEIIYLKDRFGAEMLNVLDDSFLLNKKRAYDVCTSLIEKKVGMKWFCLVRADEADYDLFCLMKKAGCLSVAPGFESGSNRILKLMNKKITIEMARECVKMASKAGLLINGQLIVGFPTETEEDVELMVKFIKDNPEVDTWGLHTFFPFPGCDVWNNPDKYGIEIDKETDFSDYHSVGDHTGLYHKDPVIDGRFRYVKEHIGNKSRELRRKLM